LTGVLVPGRKAEFEAVAIGTSLRRSNAFVVDEEVPDQVNGEEKR